MSETPARDGMLDFALAAFKDSPNPVVAAHANKLADAFEAEVRAAVPSAPAARSAILREAADRLSQVPFTNVLTELRRMADEAQQLETPSRTTEERCGAEPPNDGQWGDCWCTLTPGHNSEHRCQPCTDRYEAPGWTDQPAVEARQADTAGEQPAP